MFTSIHAIVFSNVAQSQPAKPAQKQNLTRNNHSRSCIFRSLKSRRLIKSHYQIALQRHLLAYHLISILWLRFVNCLIKERIIIFPATECVSAITHYISVHWFSGVHQEKLNEDRQYCQRQKFSHGL